MKSILLVLLVLGSGQSRADVNCTWIPTFQKPAEEVAALIEERTGKKPTVSCGGGTDYKVCHSCVDRLTDEQWEKVRLMMADPAFRQWHRNWHQEDHSQSESIARRIASTPEKVGGESFFFMHRELIRSVNANAAALDLPCLRGWDQLPRRVDDPVWPTAEHLRLSRGSAACDAATEAQKNGVAEFVTALDARMLELRTEMKNGRAEIDAITDPTAREAAFRTFMEEMRTRQEALRTALLAEFGVTEDLINSLQNCPSAVMTERLQANQRALSDRIAAGNTPAALRAVDLGALGASITNSWHGNLHFLYAVNSEGCTAGGDAPNCDDMMDPYASHVNQNFYQVHGLVDNHIDKWLSANGYETASHDCTGKARCYQYGEIWWGNMPDYVTGTGCSYGRTPAAPPVETETESSTRAGSKR